MSSRSIPSRDVLIPLLLVLGVGFLMAFLARGTAGDEEIAHYLLARWAPAHPELFLSLVGRPLVTLMLAIPAQLGLPAARLVSALATVVTAACVMRLILKGGWVAPGWGALLLLVQPFFLAHAATAMTEPWTGMLLAMGLVSIVERRALLLAIVAALLPLARLELALFWPVVLVISARWHGMSRRWFAWSLGLILPILIWNFLGAMRSGDWLWLIHQSEWGAYPEREASHYLRCLAWIIGPGLLPLVLLGIVEMLAHRSTSRTDARDDEAATNAHRVLLAAASLLAALLVIYTIFAWLRPVTFGNLRYMAAAAPALAILAAAGAARLARPFDRITWMSLLAGGLLTIGLWSHQLADDFIILPRFWPVPIVAFLLVALVAVAVRGRPAAILLTALSISAIFLPLAYRNTLHWGERTEERAARLLAASARPLMSGGTRIIAPHPALRWRLGIDPYDTRRSGNLDPVAIESSSPGTVLVWDSHYAPGLTNGVDPARLVKSGRWAKRADATASDTSWAGAIFVRLGKSAPGIGSAEEEGQPLSAGESQSSSLSDAALLGAGGDESPEADPWYRMARSAQLRLSAVRRLVEADPLDADRWRNFARGLLAAGRSEEGLNAFIQAARLDPDNADNDIFRAEVLRRSGENAKALDAVRRALVRQPDNGEAHLLAARILESLGQKEESITHEFQAAQHLPDRWDIQYRAGRLHFDRSEWPAGAECLRRTIQLRPGHADAPLYLARALMYLDDQPGAEQVLRVMIRRLPELPRGWVALGDVLAITGRTEEARRVWQAGTAASGGDRMLEARLKQYAATTPKSFREPR